MSANDSRDLILTRDIDLPAASLYRCWTEPALLTQWFTPRPWTTTHAELDVRPGGTSHVVMRSPEGVEHPNPWVYLEVEPNRKLVLTDAYIRAGNPLKKPFVTIVLTFEPMDENRTRYTALVRHWTIADREQHEAMGFFTGWNQATDQLVETASSL
jgi:uncharacterized protein YndB with AHSA1/START domain